VLSKLNMCHTGPVSTGSVKTAASIRTRVRAEMVEEIKAAARRHLAVEGANLSLRAVARELGMVSSALYRYFPSRDDLLTALIVDAYTALGAAVDAADASRPRADLVGRAMAICHAVRDWARANPNEYALIYGSPVPGYHAPADTVEPANRPALALTRILADGVESGALPARYPDRLPRAVRADLERLRATGFPHVPAALMARGMAAWIQLFGLVSFELFGRLHGVVEDHDAFFDQQMGATLRQILVVPDG
jgi:AcrR family transcriptional regulator